jgi:hypothetical protein
MHRRYELLLTWPRNGVRYSAGLYFSTNANVTPDLGDPRPPCSREGPIPTLPRCSVLVVGVAHCKVFVMTRPFGPKVR